MFGSSEEREIRKGMAMLLAMQGIRGGMAKTMARDLVSQAVQDVRRAGDPGPAYGDRLLHLEATDASARSLVETLRREGCTDGDIRAWYNLSALERAATRILMNHQRLTAFAAACDEGLDGEEAALRVRLACAFYEEPPFDPKHYELNQTLPYAMKARVETWLSRRSSGDIEAFRIEVEEAEGINRLFRQELAAGRV